MFWPTIPIILQGIVMMIDEFYFHHKRGLPLWEKIGHPLDSLTVLSCYLFLILKNPTESNIKIYIALCIFSCLFITKDEFVHSEKCDPLENWLHSVLFLLHPITFLAAGVIWINQLSSTFLTIQFFIILAFMIYQILFWGLRGKSK